MTNKKQVSERLGYFDRHLLEGNVKIVIKNLEALHALHPGYTDFFLEIEYNWEDPDELILYGRRDETDDERAKRLIREAKYRAKKEASKERAKKAAAAAKKNKEAKEKEELRRLMTKYKDFLTS